MHPIDQIRQFTTLTPELEKKLRLIMRDKTFAKGETIHSSQMLRTGSFYKKGHLYSAMFLLFFVLRDFFEITLVNNQMAIAFLFWAP